MKGPCGTPCRECPERDACEQDCNVKDKQEEKKSGDPVCCTSSKDKMALRDEMIREKANWQNQPKDLFPKELLDDASKESVDLSTTMRYTHVAKNYSQAGVRSPLDNPSEVPFSGMPGFRQMAA